MSDLKIIFEKGILIQGQRRRRSCDVTVTDGDLRVHVETSAFLCDGGSLSPSEASRAAMSNPAHQAFSKQGK